MALLHSLTLGDLVITFFALTIIYVVSLVVYRLWFSPITDFPGPLLARTTFWYEFYYSSIKLGTYYLKIKEMHEKYGTYTATYLSSSQAKLFLGPIVRVTPDELHINEPLFYHELFVTGAVRRTNNYPRAGDGTGFEGRLFIPV